MKTIRWTAALETMDAFRKRFEIAPETRVLGNPVVAPKISRLNPLELVEFRTVLGIALSGTDHLMGRVSLMDVVASVLLDGARDKSELMFRTGQKLRAGMDANGLPAEVKQQQK